jgi:cyclic pyranopterin monophosphate synthase
MLAGMSNHFNELGEARMVDVSSKPITQRVAVAEGRVAMAAATLRQVLDRKIAKGDVLAVARLAGIQAAKQTCHLIPLCHLLPLDRAEVTFDAISETEIRIEATVSTHGRTGVEMEALTAVSVAGLTIYDMCKAIDREMAIGSVRLISKEGGARGNWRRPLSP